MAIKAAPTLLALSLCANLGILAHGFLLPDSTTPTIDPAPSPRITQTSEVLQAEKLLKNLRAGDIKGLPEAFKAASLSPELCYNLMRALIAQKYRDERMALDAEYPVEEQPYWKGGPKRRNIDAYNRKCAQLFSDEERELMELSQPNSELTQGKPDHKDLGQSIARKLTNISKDYDEMREALFKKSAGFHLPSDDEKFAYLNAQEKADIAAALSPEELKHYELSRDYRATSLALNYGDCLNSEAEFESLLALEKETQSRIRDGKYAYNSPEASALMIEAEAKRQALLGPERTKSLLESRDPDTRLVHAACERLGLGATGEKQLLELRDAYDVKGRLIASNPCSSPEEKAEALKALSAEAKTQLVGILGDEAGKAYANRSTWCGILASGASFTRSCSGGYLANRMPTKTTNVAAVGEEVFIDID